MNPKRPSAFVRVALLCCAAIAPAARAGDIFESLRRVPASAEIVLVVDNLAEHRRSEFGQGATALIHTALALGAAGDPRTIEAWSAFAQRLGLTPAAAFDELLGSRITFIARRDDAGELRWAVLSAVHPKTSLRLRERLDVEPRDIKSRQIVMTVEGGRWLLASTLGERPAGLVLAPLSSKSLFDDVLRLADFAGAPTVADDPHIAQARSLGAGELLLIARGADIGCAFLAATASRAGDTVSSRFLLEPDQPLPDFLPWPADRWDELRDGALFALVERLPSRSEIDAADIDAPVREILDLPRAIVGPELDLIFGSRVAVTARRDDDRALNLSFAFESADVTALAKPGDEAMRILLAQLGSGLGAGERSFSFAGVAPHAVRRVTLARPPGQPPMPIAGGALDVLWSFRADESAPPSGWWIVATDRAPLELMSRALTSESLIDQKRQWLSLFESRPAELLAALEAWGMPVAHPLDAARWITDARASTWAESPTLIRGEGALTLRRPPAAGAVAR